MARTQRETIIRIASTRDVYIISDMSRRLIEQGLPWRWKASRVYHHLQHPDSVVIVADRDGTVTGFAIASFGETDVHINLLAVEETAWREGTGGRLLAWLTASARVAGIASINLEVRRSNHGATAFYEKHGFETVGMHKGYYEGQDDARLMSLRLIGHDHNK